MLGPAVTSPDNSMVASKLACEAGTFFFKLNYLILLYGTGAVSIVKQINARVWPEYIIN